MGQAPQEFTVAGVTGVSEEPWGDNGDMLTTKVIFTDGDREWKIHHNVAWPVAISQGSVLEGWKNFEKGTFGLSKKHKGDDPGPARRSGGASKSAAGPGLTWKSAPYERGAEHPRNEVRMIHTSSLSAAVPFINQMVAFGFVTPPADEDAYWKLVGHVAGKLTASYQKPLGATEAPAQSVSQPQLNGGEVPADTAGLTPGPVGVSDDVPFHHLPVSNFEIRRRDLFTGDRWVA